MPDATQSAVVVNQPSNMWDIISKVVDYVFKQQLTVVLLLISIISPIVLIGLTIWYYVPKHLQQIQTGYEKIATEYVTEKTESRKEFKESLALIREAFDKQQDKQNDFIEKILLRFDKMQEKPK